MSRVTRVPRTGPAGAGRAHRWSWLSLLALVTGLAAGLLAMHALSLHHQMPEAATGGHPTAQHLTQPHLTHEVDPAAPGHEALSLPPVHETMTVASVHEVTADAATTVQQPPCPAAGCDTHGDHDAAMMCLFALLWLGFALALPRGSSWRHDLWGAATAVAAWPPSSVRWTAPPSLISLGISRT